MFLVRFLRPTPLLRSSRYLSTTTQLPIAPNVQNVVDDPEGKSQARDWIQSFEDARLQRSDVELSFARSSGPGGQNVNKVNTKAIVRCRLGSKWIPPWAKAGLRKSPAYVQKDDSLLMSSTRHRSQAENVEDCLTKLHNLVLTASKAEITNVPSEEQKKRVSDLQEMHAGRLKKLKQQRSAVKKTRGRSGWDD